MCPQRRCCVGRRCYTTSASRKRSRCRTARCTSSGTRWWARAWRGAVLRRLRFDRESSERIQRLVAEHLRPNLYTPEWTDGAVRRFLRETDDITDDLFALSRADITSYRRSRVEAGVARVNHLEARCRELQAQEDVAQLKSPLDGNDLMTMFDRGPGPWIKPIKEHLLNHVIDGDLAQDDRETAGELAQKFADEHPEVFGA